ncbi:MAG: nucleotidyltransferase family protein [Gammaproteobacteria bacterium]
MSYDWRKTVVGPEATVEYAIKVIDKEALRIALVVDDKFQLLGTVTDGDVRRGLINKLPLDTEVVNVMNSTPMVSELGAPRHQLLALMEEKRLLSIPIVDRGVLVGLETLQDLMTRPTFDNPVFLMAGGFGTRLRPLTDECPKPLIRVGDKPILQTILESFVEAGFHDFYISTHFMPEMIEDYFGDGSKWGVNINYVYEEEPLGTGGALGLLPKNLPNLPIIMMNGDILTKVDYIQLLNYHSEHDAVATMCVREYDYQVPYGVIEGEGHKIISMVEKPEYKFFVNAGIYVLNPSILNKVSSNQKIDMPTLLEKSIEKNELVAQFPVHEYWLDVGKMNDLEQAQKDFIKAFK